MNASGVFGHHLSATDILRAIQEGRRVLKDGGLAALDCGPNLSRSTLRHLLNEQGFQVLRCTRSNPFDRTGQVVARRLPMA